MHDAVVIVVKAVFGGALVVVFALLGHLLRPKWFAGLFGAAPSIAIASLIITVIDKGHHDASLAAQGMIFGVLGFIAFALLVRPLIDRTSVILASGLASALWATVAVGTYLVVVK